MSQLYTWLSLQGLVTNPNWRRAEGSVQAANNISFATPGVAQLRRGIKTAATGPTYTTRGLSIAPLHEDKLLTHWSDGTIRSLGSTFFSATTYAHPAGSSVGVRWARAGGRLFFTTSKGLYKVASPTASVDLLPAGGFDGGTPVLSVLTNSAGLNWLTAAYTVAYRVLLVRKDNLANIVAGEPSARAVVTNTAGATRCPTVRCYLPYQPTNQDTVTLQLYRSAADSGGLEPSDDMGLVYERDLTASDLSTGYVDILDVCPDALRGEALYTNARQEGISQRRSKPHKMYDAAEFGGCLWGARTTPPHRLLVDLVGIDSTGGYTSHLVVDGVTYEEGAEVLASRNFVVQTTGTASQNVRATAESLCRCINYQYRSTSGGVRASVIGDGTTGIATILLERESLDGGVIYFATVAEATNRLTFAPSSPTATYANAAQVSRAGSTVTVNSATAHGLAVGDSVWIGPHIANANFPNGIKTVVTAPSATQFTYTESGAAATSTNGHFLFKISSLTIQSAAPEQKNRLAFSRQDEPEGWPEENEFFVGAANEPINRIFASRDSLWVFKDDGVWRISGYSPDTFALQAFDSSLALHADNSLALGEGQVYGWFETGIYALDESGARRISEPIQDQVDLDRPVTSSGTKAHGVWDPWDNSYQLWRQKGDTAGASTGWFGLVYWPSTQAWSEYQYGNDPSASAVTKPPSSLSLPDAPTVFLLHTLTSGSGTSDVVCTRDTHANGHLWFDFVDTLIQASLSFIFPGGNAGEMKHFQGMRVMTNVTRAGATEAFAFAGCGVDSPNNGVISSTRNLVDGSSDASPATATKLAVGRSQFGYRMHAPIDSRRGSSLAATLVLYSGGAPDGGGADGGSNIRIEGIEIAWRATRNTKASHEGGT